MNLVSNKKSSSTCSESHVGNFIQNLNSNQYQQLLNMLSTHLTTSDNSTGHHEPSSTNTYSASTCFSVSLSSDFSSTCFWIVDSGATRHICSNASLFTALRLVQNYTVTLLNHAQISVAFFLVISSFVISSFSRMLFIFLSSNSI